MADPKAPDIVDGWLRLEAGYFLGEIFVAMYEPEALEVSHGVPEDDETRRSFDPHTTACMPLPVLRALLSSHGLAIVTEADKRVLEAMNECYDKTRALGLHSMQESDELWDHSEKAMRLIAEQRGEEWKTP